MLVTDRHRCPAGRSLASIVDHAVSGGVNLVQLREKDLDAAHLLRLARELMEALAGRALLLVNDRADVAVAAGAAGVHLGAASLPVPEARAVAGLRMLLGRSVHTLEEAQASEAEGADYLVVGSLFETASHPGMKPQGLGLARQVCETARVPVLGIGGITPERVPSCLAAGVSGVAVISALLAAQDPRDAACRFVEALRGQRG
jgi:thiamine-phosphate pyrophosphorylase